MLIQSPEIIRYLGQTCVYVTKCYLLTSDTNGVSQLSRLVLGRDLAQVITSVRRLSQRDDQRVAIFRLFEFDPRIIFDHQLLAQSDDGVAFLPD